MSRSVAIVGSRGFRHLKLVDEYVAGLPEGTIIVSGGARGVDSRAEKAARRRGMTVVVYHPDWERHGERAGLVRNERIVSAADKVVAFWDRRSWG